MVEAVAGSLLAGRRYLVTTSSGIDLSSDRGYGYADDEGLDRQSMYPDRRNQHCVPEVDLQQLRLLAGRRYVVSMSVGVDWVATR